MARRILRDLRLDKIAAVDKPCQEHATSSIIKRAFTAEEREQAAKDGTALPDGSFPIISTADLKNAVEAYGRAKDKDAAKKHIIRRARALGAINALPEDWEVKKLADAILKAESDGAKTFSEVLDEAEGQRRQWEAQEELWPLFSALQSTLGSIAQDAALDRNAKMARINESVGEFLTAIGERWPEVEDELEKLFTPAGNTAGDHIGKKETPMPDDVKKVADLEKQVADLTKANQDLTAQVADLNKAQEIAKSDEILKVGETEVRKSAVGEASFAMLKAQQAEITKERDKREMAELKKRADDDFRHVPGSTDERAAMLKAMGGLDEPLRKSFEAVFTAHEALAKSAFNTLGHRIGKVEDTGSPEQQLDKMAADYARENKVSKAAAYDAVLKTEEGRKLYADSVNTQSEADERRARA